MSAGWFTKLFPSPSSSTLMTRHCSAWIELQANSHGLDVLFNYRMYQSQCSIGACFKERLESREKACKQTMANGFVHRRTTGLSAGVDVGTSPDQLLDDLEIPMIDGAAKRHTGVLGVVDEITQGVCIHFDVHSMLI